MNVSNFIETKTFIKHLKNPGFFNQEFKYFNNPDLLFKIRNLYTHLPFCKPVLRSGRR